MFNLVNISHNTLPPETSSIEKRAFHILTHVRLFKNHIFTAKEQSVPYKRRGRVKYKKTYK